MIPVQFNVNGTSYSLKVEPGESALDTIRTRIGLTGTKEVCGGGVCGACTVLKDGEPVISCLLPTTSLEGSSVTTIEGIESSNKSGVQQVMAREDALQCGYCTPGFVLGITHFANTWKAKHSERKPSRDEIASALAGHLCRCGSYAALYRAVDALFTEEEMSTENPWGKRIGAKAKLTGEAKYTTDIQPDGLLYAVIARSPFGSGTLRNLDFSRALEIPGVVAAVKMESAGAPIRWVGQPIAAIAAESISIARAAAAAIETDIETKTGVYTIEQAMASTALPVYNWFWQAWRAPLSIPWPALPAIWWNNLRMQLPLCWFGILALVRIALARYFTNPLLYEEVFETAAQVHSSFEPHAAVAKWEDDKLTVWVSTQAVDDVRQSLSKKLGLAVNQIAVIAEFVGGGFGSKLNLSSETLAAVMLAKESSQPVSVVLNRLEELSTTGSRAETRTKVSILAKSDGRLAASNFTSDSNGGISVGSSVAALNLLLYSHSPRRSHDRDVTTNAQASTSMRGPCGPPAAWALESSIDQLAYRLGQDPIVFRQRIDGNQKRQELYEWVAESSLWARRQARGSGSGRFRRGIGFAASNWFYFVDPGSQVTVAVEAGRLVATVAAQDIGQGSATVVAQTVAEVFDFNPHDIDVKIGRSEPTHGPSSSGSRTTVSIGPTAREAASKLKAIIGGEVSSAHDGASVTETRGGDIGIRAMPITINNTQIGWGFTAAVHATELEVDCWTGQVRVIEVLCGIAAGKLYAEQQARRQVEGGIIQGIGYALYEEVQLDPNAGFSLSSNMQDYKIPQMGDTPEITMHFNQEGWPYVPGEGVGLSEVSSIGVAASIGNAIFNATGWRPTKLPIRPDRILEAIK
jgi:xanthine dehydrogenase YagR molybdenum-binding subunit